MPRKIKRISEAKHIPKDDKAYQQDVVDLVNLVKRPRIDGLLYDSSLFPDFRAPQISVSKESENNANLQHQQHEQYDDSDDDNRYIEAFDEPTQEVVDYGNYEEEEEEPEIEGTVDDNNLSLSTEEDHIHRPQKINEVEGILIAFLNQIKANQTDIEASRNARMINLQAKPPLIKSTDVRCMRKKVPNAFNPIVLKKFYPRDTQRCKALVTVSNLKHQSPQCEDGHESCRIRKLSKVAKEDGSFFCSVPLLEWLKHLVAIYYHKLRLVCGQHSTSEYLHDIYDGKMYKETVDPNAAYPTLTITLAWDGVETTTKGSKAIWPLIAYLNELPFNIRIHNAMLLALHAGSSKPSSDQMFRPLVDELLQMEREPISIKINGTEKRFFVKLLLFIADGPARAMALNCCSHTSKYGCHSCDNEFQYNTTYSTPIFRTKNLASIKYRKDEQWTAFAQKAVEARRNGKSTDESHYRGIKGPCELGQLKYLKLSRLFPPETLHSVFEGTVKSILRHWLDEDLRGKSWFTKLPDSEKNSYRNRHLLKPKKQVISQVDKNLAKIKFPNKALKEMPQICRMGEFKAMDYEMLLFYGCFCFDTLIRKESLDNFKLLALIISKLSARNVDRQKLPHIRKLVDHFLKSFENIYGNDEEQYMWRLNVHHIAHLCDHVEWYGPLPTQSGFISENSHGLLGRKVVTGTNVQQQGFNKYTNHFSVLNAVSQMLNHSSTSSEFIEEVEKIYPSLAKSERSLVSKVSYDPDSMQCQPTRYDTASTEAKNLISTFLGEEYQNATNLFSLKRARWDHPDFGKQSICTLAYNDTDSTTTNNHCIKVRSTDGGFGSKYFIISWILYDRDTNKIWILGREILVDETANLKFSSFLFDFDYAWTFKSMSPNLSVLQPLDFVELVSYCQDVHGKNYVLDLFRHM